MNDPTFAMPRPNPMTGGYRLAKAGAFAVLSLLACAAAHALGLGRLTVQSALGEPLRAEIEVSSITPAEEASLGLRIASVQAYRSAGIEFNEVLTAARLTLVRRPDGRVVVEVRSDRPARDPFIDLILEASWATGRQVREYTLLINPPASSAQVAGSPGVAVAAAITAPPAPAAPIPAPASPVAPTPEAAAAAPVTPAPAPQPDGAPPAPAAAPAAVNATTAPVPLQQAAASTALQPLSPAPEAGPVPAPVPAPVSAPAAVTVSPAPSRAPTSAAAQSASRPESAAAEPGKRHVVQAGETLYRVASQHRPEGVSLDQMLVSLYRDNPQAFAGRNMNRLMAGAVLTFPSVDQARTVDETEAKGLIEAQSADFGAYRSRLAAAVPQAAQEPAASRQASGRVQARVQDRKAQAAPTPDQLQLSQGGVKAASSPEAGLSRSAAAREASRREAELARNVEALRQLQQMAGGAPAKAASSAAAGSGGAAGGTGAAGAGPALSTATASPAAPVALAAASGASASAASAAPAVAAGLPNPAASAPPEGATVLATPASSAASAAAAASAASASAAAAPASAASVAAGRVTSLQETLLQSPYTVPVAASLVVLLAALGAFRLVRGRHTPLPETDFLASRYEGGSRSFGAEGPDTMWAGANGSRAGLEGDALSQLGAMSDVDPVAEADVYLAYGRDLQAEEILREAMRSAPQRLDIPVKLLEVLALRRDAASFDSLARQLHESTGGEGPEWDRVASMGRTLDPDNPIYASAAPGFDAVGQDLDDVTPPAPVASPFPPAPQDETPAAPEAFAAALSSAQEALGPEPEVAEASDFSLDLGQEPDLSAPQSDAAHDALAEEAPQSERSPQDLEVDLGAVDLTADETLEPAPLPQPEDPLQRKLALAHEFLQIGDLDAARDLLDEVLAQADGALKDRARELLDTLG